MKETMKMKNTIIKSAQLSLLPSKIRLAFLSM